MKKNLFWFVVVIVIGFVLRELAHNVYHLYDAQGASCAYGLQGQGNEALWREVCPRMGFIAGWIWDLGMVVWFLAPIFASYSLKNRTWIMWIVFYQCATQLLQFSLWRFIPYDFWHSDFRDFLFFNEEWILTTIVLFLSLLAWDRKHKNFVARFFAMIWKTTEPA